MTTGSPEPSPAPFVSTGCLACGLPRVRGYCVRCTEGGKADDLRIDPFAGLGSWSEGDTLSDAETDRRARRKARSRATPTGF